MGGLGSGRHGGWATVEGCRTLRLNVNVITRGVRERVRSFRDGERILADPVIWSWTGHGEAEPWARVSITLTLDRWRGRARLQYDVDHWSRRTGPQDETVQMVTTPCRFGGRRWWWVCPATGRRCATLYLPNGGTRFLSRGKGGYQLAYASQSECSLDRSHRRQAKLYAKLGGDYRMYEDPVPHRPRGMRRRTYARLVGEIEAAMEAHELVFETGAARILARMLKLGGAP